LTVLVYNRYLTGSPQADQSFALLCPGVDSKQYRATLVAAN
jgi:hypothetical protein